MHADWINIGLAFIEGFALIISPCILPILPIILSASLTGSRARPIGIILGFIATFTVFTLFSRALLQLFHIDGDTLRNVSYLILLLLGIIMVSSYLTEKFSRLTNRLLNVGSSLKTANNQQGGLWGGILFGGLVGIIWTPCAGPILAAVIVQVIVQKTTLNSVLVVLAFGIGAALPMFLIALIGREVMSKFSFFRNQAVLLRKILGLIIIAAVILLFYDASLTFSNASSKNANAASGKTLINGVEHPYPAPAIAGIDAWVNSSSLTLNDLKGKVVLIDFWTYSCINCIRTFPYLKEWYAKYHDQGLEIIGIHSPEFQFERSLENVKQAVEKYGIRYPVALDNRFVTWQNFDNEYWPAHYLINKEGLVVYEHYGEGKYDVTENNIRYLLGMDSLIVKNNVEESYSYRQTPETYLGYARIDRFANQYSIVKNQPVVYHYDENLAENSWSLNGKWIMYPDRIVSAAPNAAVKLNFNAGQVFAVMGVRLTPVTVNVLLNGQTVLKEKGSDVTEGKVTVKGHQLYSLIDLKKPGKGTLELVAGSEGVEIYTFTFGN